MDFVFEEGVEIIDRKTTEQVIIGVDLGLNNACVCSAMKSDGSGYVQRNEHNYSLCTFQNGKKYHCDLSASYNIGARYFIRELLKSLSATARLGIEAKVPQCTKRITCTLSTLISLNAELAA